MVCFGAKSDIKRGERYQEDGCVKWLPKTMNTNDIWGRDSSNANRQA